MHGLKQHKLYKTISKTSFSKEPHCDIKKHGFHKSLEFKPGVVFLVLDDVCKGSDNFRNSEYKCLVGNEIYYLSISNFMIKTFLVAVEPE